MTEEPTSQAAPAATPPLAARYGLVRPRQGRYVAGVGAALGRATRTDPVLWRVVLAVLVCFAGLGALIYILVWLLTPEDGDTASPIESLLGRGYSSTSPVVSGLLGLATVGLLAIILPRPFYLTLAAAVVLLVVLLINRTRISPAAAGPDAPPDPAAPPGPPWPPGPDSPPGPAAQVAPAAPPGPATQATPAPAAGTPPAGPGPVPAPAPAAAPPPPLPATTPVPGPVPVGPAASDYRPGWSTGYRPAFAPHGPFAGPPPPPPPPPRPPRERSALPAIAFFAIVIVLGMLGVLDLLEVLNVPVAGYVATALAMVGGGLLVGAWLGRARALIVLGVVLALALPAAHAVDTWDQPDYLGGEFSWTPERRADLPDEYELMFGTGRLDLRQLDLAGEEVEIAVHVTFGEVQIIVPEDAAVEATVDTRFGGATVLGTVSEGVTRDTITDPGSGDPADGTIVLDLRARFAGAEVIR